MAEVVKTYTATDYATIRRDTNTQYASNRAYQGATTAGDNSSRLVGIFYLNDAANDLKGRIITKIVIKISYGSHGSGHPMVVGFMTNSKSAYSSSAKGIDYLTDWWRLSTAGSNGELGRVTYIEDVRNTTSTIVLDENNPVSELGGISFFERLKEYFYDGYGRFCLYTPYNATSYFCSTNSISMTITSVTETDYYSPSAPKASMFLVPANIPVTITAMPRGDGSLTIRGFTIRAMDIYKNGTRLGSMTLSNNNYVGNYTYTPTAADRGTTLTFTYKYEFSPSLGAPYQWSYMSESEAVNVFGAATAPTAITLNNISGDLYVGATNTPTITLAWSGGNPGTFSLLYNYIIEDATGSTGVSAGTATSRVVTRNIWNSISPNTFKVRILPDSGEEALSSITRSIYTIGTPGTVTNLQAKNSSGTLLTQNTYVSSNVVYSWTAPSTPTNSSLSYLIYRDGTLLTTTTSPTYTLDISTINRGQAFQVQVVVRATATNGGYNDGAKVNAVNLYRNESPTTPTNLTLRDNTQTNVTTHAESVVYIGWSWQQTSTQLNYYNIQYSTDNSSWFNVGTVTAASGANSITHNITGIARGTLIYYRVTAFDVLGEQSGFVTGVIKRNSLPTITKFTASTPFSALVPSSNWTLSITLDPDNANYTNTAYHIYAHYGNNSTKVATGDFTTSYINGTVAFTSSVISALGLTNNALNQNVRLSVYLEDKIFPGTYTATTYSTYFNVDLRTSSNDPSGLIVSGAFSSTVDGVTRRYFYGASTTPIQLSWTAAINPSYHPTNPDPNLEYFVEVSVGGDLLNYIVLNSNNPVTGTTTPTYSVLPSRISSQAGMRDMTIQFRVRARTKEGLYSNYTDSSLYYLARTTSPKVIMSAGARDLTNPSKITALISTDDLGISTLIQNPVNYQVGFYVASSPWEPTSNTSNLIAGNNNTNILEEQLFTYLNADKNTGYYIRAFIKISQTAAGVPELVSSSSPVYIPPSYPLLAFRKSRIGVNWGELEGFSESLLISGSNISAEAHAALGVLPGNLPGYGGLIKFYPQATLNPDHGFNGYMGVDSSGTFVFGHDRDGLELYNTWDMFIANGGKIGGNLEFTRYDPKAGGANVNDYAHGIVFSNLGGYANRTARIVRAGNDDYGNFNGNGLVCEITSPTRRILWGYNGTMGVFNIYEPYIEGDTYAHGAVIISGDTIAYSTVRPAANNNKTLGEASYRWSNVYSVLGNFSGAVTMSNTLAVDGTSSMRMIVPAATNSYDIGSTTYRWRGIYSGTGDFSGNVNVTGTFIVNGQSSMASIAPNINDTYTVGNLTYRWRGIYAVAGDFSGAVTIGGVTTINNSLYVASGYSTILAGTLAVSSSTTLGGSLAVSGITTFSSAVRPSSNNTVTLGDTNYRWSSIYAQSLNVAGSITAEGGYQVRTAATVQSGYASVALGTANVSGTATIYFNTYYSSPPSVVITPVQNGVSTAVVIRLQVEPTTSSFTVIAVRPDIYGLAFCWTAIPRS